MPRYSSFSMVRSRCFERRARTAASRGLELTRDVDACLFSMCGRPPDDADVLDLNVTKRAECEARHTSKSFFAHSPATVTTSACAAAGSASARVLPRLLRPGQG